MKELFNAFPFVGAFLAGILSFLSPCVLPLVPSYISFITGVSFEDLRDGTDRKKIRFLTVTNSLAFVSGFSTIFIALGASSSAVGNFLFQYQDWIRIGGGILVIFFGFFISGIIRLDFLTREMKFHMSGKPMGYIGSFFVGMTFAAAWTPCIGPILGTILLYASTMGSAVYGFKLLAVYSLGLALPFFLSSLMFNSFLSYSGIIKKYMRYIMIVSGMLLIVFGILMLTNNVRQLTGLFPDINIESKIKLK